MCRLVFLFLCIGTVLVASAQGKPYYNLAEAEKHFADFIQKHNKLYETDEEYNNRFEIFKANVERINYWNEHEESTFELNSLADMTYEDLIKTCGADPTPANASEKAEIPKEWIVNAPDSLDYRTQGLVTDPKSQGHCGSCYVFGTIGYIEGQHAKKTGQLVSLSEQQGLDCSQGTCKNGGRPIFVMNGLAQQGGSMKEADYPYVGQKGRCHTDPNKIVVRVSGGQEISTPTEQELMAAVAQYGPLATGMFMSPQLQNAGGSVMSPTDCAGHPNHVILLVGYGTDAASGKKYWIIKNSYGSGYGAQGFLLLERGLCSVGVDFSTVGQVQ